MTATDAMSRRHWSPRPGTPPTQRDLEVLAAALLMSRKEAAGHLGIHWVTVRAHLANLYIRLGVLGRLEAAQKLGWLCIPSHFMVGSGARTTGYVPGPDRKAPAPTVRRLA